MATLINRLLSLLIALSYLASCYERLGFSSGTIKVSLCLLLILSFIWFGELWGEHTMGLVMHGSRITTATPGILVAAMGWFLLVGAPFVVGLFSTTN